MAAAVAGCTPTYRTGPEAVPLQGRVDKVDEIADLVPGRIANDGILDIGTDPSYPPMEFFEPEGDRITGVDIDLALAISAVLDLRPVFALEAFTGLEASVRSRGVELGIAALTVPSTRSLSTDAVIYLRAGTQLAVRTGSAARPNQLCGFAIATLEGSIQVRDLARRSRACVEDGGSPIRVLTYGTQEQVTAAVRESIADGMLADSPVVQWAVVQHPEDLVPRGRPTNVSPYGILTNANERQFAQAVAAAVDHLIDTGVYEEILLRWGVVEGAVPAAYVVPGR